jgi:hypothetical protein
MPITFRRSRLRSTTSGGSRQRPALRDAFALVALAPWAAWAAVRLLGLEPGAPLIGALALTPLMAATAWLPVLLALALRSWVVATLAALVAVALASAVLPRALGGPQTPLASGRSLSVMTANLRYGHADPAAVMQLVRRHDVDVLSLQELTPAAARRLDRAGARASFPYRVLEPRTGANGSGLLSRLPMRDGARPTGTPHAMPQAQLAVPGVGSVLVKAVHTIPPLGGDVPADVLSVDNQMDGGLLNLKRGAGMAEVAGLPVLKHSLGELGIAAHAAAHVIASTPNFLHASQSYASLLADDVVEGGALPYEGGALTVPERPGIGVELDAERVARYAELYKREGQTFGFHDPAALEATPLLPKR